MLGSVSSLAGCSVPRRSITQDRRKNGDMTAAGLSGSILLDNTYCPIAIDASIDDAVVNELQQDAVEIYDPFEIRTKFSYILF
jgi:hypothetical protein